jgi:hypothetical protein
MENFDLNSDNWLNNGNVDNTLNFLYYPNSHNETKNNNNNIFFYLFTTVLKHHTTTTTSTISTQLQQEQNSSDCTLKPSYILEEQICYLYIMCPLAIIGLILNIISIKVFNDKSFNTVAFCYLRLMTYFDLIICAIIIIYCLTAYTSSLNKYDLFIRHLYLAYIYIPIANIASNLTMLIKLLVTAERLISIRWPTKKYKLFKKSRYYISCVIVVLISIVFNFLYFFLYEVHLCSLSTREFTKTIYWKTYGYVKEVLMRVVPIVLLTGANGLLIYTVKMSRKRMQNSRKNSNAIIKSEIIDIAANKRSRQDLQLTVMTIIVAAMYSICSVPMVFAYPGLVFDEPQLSTKFYRIYAASVNILELIQSSFRFIIYYSFTTQFRNIFLNRYFNFFNSSCNKQSSNSTTECELLNNKKKFSIIKQKPIKNCFMCKSSNSDV